MLLPLLCTILTLPGCPQGDLDELIRDFRRAAVRQSDDEGREAAAAALKALVATGDAEAAEALAAEFAQSTNRLVDAEDELQHLRVTLVQGERLLAGLRLRAEQDETLLETVKEQARVQERASRRQDDLLERLDYLGPWRRTLIDGTSQLLGQLSTSKRRGVEKRLWAQAEDDPDWNSRLAAIAMLGGAGASGTATRLQKMLASLAADALRLERGLPRKEVEVRKMEARMQKENDQTGGGMSRATAAQYDKVKMEAARDRRLLTDIATVLDECVDAAGRALAREEPEAARKTLQSLVKAQKKARDGARLRTLGIFCVVPCAPAQETLLEILEGEEEPSAIATILRGLAALGPEAIPAERVIGFLGHDSWMVQRGAIDALAALRAPEGIPALIDALEGASGRLRTDLRGGLIALTGKDYRTNITLWRRWWEGAQPGFEVPPLDRTLTAALPVEGAAGVTFFGITTESQRVLFVLDLSGSMNFSMVARSNPTDSPNRPPDQPRANEISRLTAAKRDLVRVLGGLREGAQFNLILYASDVWTWQDELVEMKDGRRLEAQEYVEGLHAAGGTNVYGALRTALEIAGVDGGDEWDAPVIDTIFLLTDGRPSVGLTTSADQILAYVREKNRSGGIVIHTIGLSGAQDAYLLSQLAEQNGGTYAGR